MASEPQTTPAVVVINPGCCYFCRRPVGVFRWSDATGVAHPWCATGESWDWKPDIEKARANAE